MGVDNRGVTVETIRGWMSSLSNWGKWGAEDQAGTLNYITPAMRAAAAGLVREGAVVATSLPLPTLPTPSNPRPALHYMVATGERDNPRSSADFFAIAYHGRSTSHIDALCHFFYQGKMYNGFSSREVQPDGAHKNSITNVVERVVGRGVLLDVPKAKGVQWLEPGEPIYVEDLEAAERAGGVTVGEGDILLMRTGRHGRERALGLAQAGEPLAGLHASVAPWLFERHVAVLGGDGVQDLLPSGFDEVTHPIHQMTIVAMGIHLLDNQDFEALARACGERSRYTFMYVVAPLLLERETGSPATGLAMF